MISLRSSSDGSSLPFKSLLSVMSGMSKSIDISYADSP